MKKIAILIACTLWYLTLSTASHTMALWDIDDWSFFYETNQDTTSTDTEAEKIEIWNLVKRDAISKQDWVFQTITNFFGMGKYVDSWSPKFWSPALWYVQMIINRLLWLVSFIALVVSIFAFYQIFFNKWEEWVTKAKKMLTWVWIALAIMWLSWIIISFFFYFYTDIATKQF
jgi:hypothetical protein